jgi:hypothetical protein
MKATTSFKRVLTVASLALAGLGLTSAVQAAQLTYDLRVVGTSAGTTIADPHSFTATVPGEILTVNLYALVQGSTDQDLSNDGFIGGAGSISHTGALDGVFRGDPNNISQANQVSQVNNVAPFNLSGIAAAGIIQDLDGDGIFDDLGTNSTGAPPAATPWFVAASDKNLGSDPYFGTGTGTGPAQFLIGQFQFTLTGSVAAGQTMNLAFVPRFKSSGLTNTKQIHKFVVDGVQKLLNGDDAQIAEIGVSVGYLVPEPSAIGMLLLGSVGLVGFRRSAFRHLVS